MNKWWAVECYTVSNNTNPQHPNGFGDDVFQGRAAQGHFDNEEKLMARHEASDHETTQDRDLLLKPEMRELNKIGALKTDTEKVGTDAD
ncbi:hypothetical protein BOTCAL_0113g00090 [Botryotinia calthae]|uniref:Uncharacterized protein n=1 Tax=Botryotinia calthae TaxID=38488 RepID=A0A4Y8D5M5_9HELO|nr:hypothetical protein BOTCAL_0113g00090 [Botryotinia calthae]